LLRKESSGIVLPVPSTQSISAISTFGEICLVLIIALSIVGGIQLWKRKRRLRLSSQRIVQFDQLQNEEENTIMEKFVLFLSFIQIHIFFNTLKIDNRQVAHPLGLFSRHFPILLQKCLLIMQNF
uniref:LPXTG cell wall anchor domain-containing protein n=1 Tax=Brugia timori TaxID=42155 RepID=A0A0R3R779_9BILA